MSIGVQIAVWALIFILLFVGFLLLIFGAIDLDKARIDMNHIMEDLRSKADMSVKKTEMRRVKYGTSTSDGDEPSLITKFIMMIDNQLVWSGTAVLRPWFTAPLYVMGTMVLSVLMFGLGYITFNAPIGFMYMCAVIIFPYALLLYQVNKNYHDTENQLKFFINLVASNSDRGPLRVVLQECIPYMAEPIRGALERAIATWEITGKENEAIDQLEREIEHPLFRNFIRNLYICSKNDANFRSVANDFSEQANQSIAALERQRAIFANARGNVLLMMVVGIFLSFFAAYFCERNLIDVLMEMRQSVLGLVCIFIECVIYMASLAYVLLGKKR